MLKQLHRSDSFTQYKSYTAVKLKEKKIDFQ